jgi:DNA-binding ferritin-like protein (Dps family)
MSFDFNLLNDVDLILQKNNTFLNYYKGKSNLTIDDIDKNHSLSNINSIILKINNVKKWTKTYKRSNTKTQEYVYFTNNETIEKLLFKNGIDNWKDVAILNNFTELDYNFSGGQKISTQFINELKRLPLQSFVDEVYGDSLLGKDIDKNVKFLNNDLSFLNEQDTLFQSANILINLQKGDNQYIKNVGVQKDIVGNTKNSLSLPIVFRQLKENFATDDSFSSISILDITLNQDNLSINIGITTVLGNFVKNNILI